MAYLRPSWFTRAIFNRIATTFSFGPFETMIVTKRVSKQPQKIPVTPIEVGGVKYLVSAYGETQWVKKVGKYVDDQFRQLPDPADHPVFKLTPQT
jgi:DNA-binding response OmpR family regulator